MSCDLRKCAHCGEWTPEMDSSCVSCGVSAKNMEKAMEELRTMLSSKQDEPICMAGDEPMCMLGRDGVKIPIVAPPDAIEAYKSSIEDKYTIEELKLHDSRTKLRKLKKTKGVRSFSQSLYRK